MVVCGSKPSLLALGDTPAWAATTATVDAYGLTGGYTFGGLARASQTLYLYDPSEKLYGAVWLAINSSLSKSNLIVYPRIVVPNKLLAIDLSSLATDPQDFAILLANVESLALDEPYFHRTFAVDVEHRPITCPKFLYHGKWFTSHRLVVPAEHLGLGKQLFSVTGRINPIMRADQFVVKVMSTTQGGRYYDFRGLAKDTTLKGYLASRGANEALVESLDSDSRVAIVRSQVSGKPRRVDFFYAVGLRPTSGIPLVAITRDVSDESLSPDFDPFYNLLNFKFNASEVFTHLSNGLLEYTLFNNKGQIVKEVPPDIAVDHEIPKPHTQRLEPAISCIRCHWKKTHDGWRLLTSDIQSLLRTKQDGTRIDVLSDISTNTNQQDVLRRLAGLYSGDYKEPFRLVRNTLSNVVFSNTHKTIEDLGKAYTQLWLDYKYSLVTPKIACNELGSSLKDDTKALETLNRLLPPLPELQPNLSLEDSVVALLKAGIGVNRFQWERVYVDLQLRANQNLVSHK